MVEKIMALFLYRGKEIFLKKQYNYNMYTKNPNWPVLTNCIEDDFCYTFKIIIIIIQYLVSMYRILEADGKFKEVFDSYCNVQIHLCWCKYLLKVINASAYNWESECLLVPRHLSLYWLSGIEERKLVGSFSYLK